MEKSYNPKSFEERIFQVWLDKKYCSAKVNKDKKPFTLVSPPPNITSQLHIGHAFNVTLQDILVRYKRMKGFEALWIQGTDHAAIATEIKILEKMRNEEHLTKEDVGREEFEKRVNAWYDKYNGVIHNQFKKMGISCDWDRHAFTMDERLSAEVRHAFVNLYNKGLIYKGNRISNWCPVCKTVISDAEIEYEDHDGEIWHLKYAIDGTDKYLTLATTRPETLFGDTAVAVNPKDERYTGIVGKYVVIPTMDKKIPIIADDYVEIEFGTGVVKITPAHDPNDYEVGKRHNLEVITVINKDATMNQYAGKYNGMDRYECRKLLVEELKEKGLLEKVEKYQNNVGHCYRCHSVLEPMISDQWFVKMESMAKKAIKVVQDKEINFYPDRMSKIYYEWLNNIKDWCISRQLWSGHRIPVYYCDDCGQTMVSEKDVKVCDKCGSTKIRQEQDVLDTWFSSALWPFAPLGFLENSEEYQYFYPSDVNVTAYDIIFFWVARMIFSSLEYTNKIPFHSVLMHGLVRDSQGRKMSKSLGNGIDPLTMIEQYGTDPLRFSLINGVAVGGDSRYSKDKTESAAGFINKMWNASRFVEMSIEGIEVLPIDKCKLTDIDKWMLTELNALIENINRQMDKFDFGLCASLLQDFFWGTFCDIYIELVKPNLQKDRQNTASVLVFILDNLLRLFHPFIPFVTEEIYQSIINNKTSIMISAYPEFSSGYNFKTEHDKIEKIIEIIKSIRITRVNMKIADNKRTKLLILPLKEIELLNDCASNIEKLAYGNQVIFIKDANEVPEEALNIACELCHIYIPLDEFIDRDKEIERLSKELKSLESELTRSERMLSNVGFTSKAPKELLDSEIAKQKKYKELYETTKLNLEKML